MAETKLEEKEETGWKEGDRRGEGRQMKVGERAGGEETDEWGEKCSAQGVVSLPPTPRFWGRGQRPGAKTGALRGNGEGVNYS